MEIQGRKNLTLSDETEIVHSQIIEEDGIQKIEVHFERPTENGFDSARCILPEYKWIKIKSLNVMVISS